MSLFNKLKVSKQEKDLLKEELNKSGFYINSFDDNENDSPIDFIKLPKEYTKIDVTKNIENMGIEERVAYKYLSNKRKIEDYKIDKYDIGYCEDGKYRGRIIIPSYDNNGDVNYFVTRSYRNNIYPKYKNPKLSRDVFPFDLYTSYDYPIIFVEGMFDAISIDFNAVPLLGNVVTDRVIETLIDNNVFEVFLFLDNDANKYVYRNCKKFIQHGIYPTIIVIPVNKTEEKIDAGSMSDEEIEYVLMNNRIKITEDNIDLLNEKDFKTLINQYLLNT